MSQKKRYPITSSMRRMLEILGADEARVLQRAGLAKDVLDFADHGVTSAQYFALWQAAFDEVGTPDLMRETAIAFAQGPFIPAVLAFSCSPNTEIGLTRLRLFKPLVAPVALEVRRVGETLELDIGSADPELELPDVMAAFEAVYFVECTRRFTLAPVVPLAVHMPTAGQDLAMLEAYFGQRISPAAFVRITLSLQDAHRPLISQNDDFWRVLELDLTQQLASRENPATVTHRVQQALVDMLPSGEASVDAVCRRLATSKRSLQRRLQAEEQSFQSVLDSTRAELSMRYLAQDNMSIEEISYLLAYRDPNSFYRAFHGWTGMTPAEARGRVLQ